MKYSRKLIENIFFNVIIPATENGYITIPIYDDNLRYEVSFNISLSVSNRESDFYLNIKDKEKFIDLLFEYFSTVLNRDKSINKANLNSKITYYLTLIWANATYEDLNNPEYFLKKYIDFENNMLFEDFIYANNISGLYNSSISVNIRHQESNFESPYVFESKIINNSDGKNLEYRLPSISYGISNNCCYIYAVQNKNVLNNDDVFQKKVNRKLYKINDGVFASETNEYIDYKNGLSDYYPENISDVSPSVIMALTVFLDSLYKKGIRKVKVVTILPIRYKNKSDYYMRKYQSKMDEKQHKMDNLLKDYEEEHLKIQRNLTEKLIRDFRRLNFHFPNVNITSYPMDVDDYIHIDLNSFTIGNNGLLNEVISDSLYNNKSLK